MKLKMIPSLLICLLVLTSCQTSGSSNNDSSSSSSNDIEPSSSVVSSENTSLPSSSTDIPSSIESELPQQQFLVHFEANGGSAVADVLYVVGDEFDLPTTKKYGQTFAGWYFDDEIFSARCNGFTDIDGEVTLYAKWVIKSVKIYLDTFYENEFEPIIKEVGETFDICELPTPRAKPGDRIEYGFSTWKDAGENLPINFVVKDQYYAFHAIYGAPAMSDKYTLYSNTFEEDYGYLDPEHSWSKIRDWPIKDAQTSTTYLNPSITANRDSMVENGVLTIQSNQSNLHYVTNGVYLPEVSYNASNNYSVSVRVKFDSYLTSGNMTSNAFTSGFGISVRQNDPTKAFVATVLDPNAKALRVAARDNSGVGSTSAVNTYANYPINSYQPSDYHTIKLVVNGQGESTTLKAYYDDILAYTYTDSGTPYSWFSTDAIGSKIGLFANGCNVSIDSVVVKNASETQTVYETDFSDFSSQSFFDGWRQSMNSIGTNNGEYNISGGRLNINSSYPTTVFMHQLIHSPMNDFSNGVIAFDVAFTEMSGYVWEDPANPASTKYFALTLRGGLEKTYEYATIAFRQNGRIQALKHTGNHAGSWSSALYTFQGSSAATAFNLNQSYRVTVVVIDKTVSLFLNDILLNSYTSSGTDMFGYDIGNIGFLASSISISIDNFKVSSLVED